MLGLLLKLSSYRSFSLPKGGNCMNNERFQELILMRLEDNEKFQVLVLEQLKALTEGQVKLEATLLKLETNIENEVIDKIRGLYDDREVQNERFDRIEEKLGSIEVDTGYLVAKVAKLERIAK